MANLMGAAVAKDVRPLSILETQLDMLTRAISDLEDHCSELRGRLNPVSKTCPAAESGGIGQPMEVLGPLADQVRSLRVRIERQIALTCTARDLLEI
jgi:hypothetical protein